MSVQPGSATSMLLDTCGSAEYFDHIGSGTLRTAKQTSVLIEPIHRAVRIFH